MVAHNYDEKRTFIRMQVETLVTYTIDGDATNHSGISLDLSATGLQMRSDYAPSEGAEIEVMMNTTSDRFPPFTAKGRVIRVIPDDMHANQFLISIEFKLSE
jgi:hypothetical protein